MSQVKSSAALVYSGCLVSLMSLSTSKDGFTIVDVSYGSNIGIPHQPISRVSSRTKTNIFEVHESSTSAQRKPLIATFIWIISVPKSGGIIYLLESMWRIYS